MHLRVLALLIAFLSLYVNCRTVKEVLHRNHLYGPSGKGEDQKKLPSTSNKQESLISSVIQEHVPKESSLSNSDEFSWETFENPLLRNRNPLSIRPLSSNEIGYDPVQLDQVRESNDDQLLITFISTLQRIIPQRSKPWFLSIPEQGKSSANNVLFNIIEISKPDTESQRQLVKYALLQVCLALLTRSMPSNSPVSLVEEKLVQFGILCLNYIGETEEDFDAIWETDSENIDEMALRVLMRLKLITGLENAPKVSNSCFGSISRMASRAGSYVQSFLSGKTREIDGTLINEQIETSEEEKIYRMLGVSLGLLVRHMRVFGFLKDEIFEATIRDRLNKLPEESKTLIRLIEHI